MQRIPSLLFVLLVATSASAAPPKKPASHASRHARVQANVATQRPRTTPQRASPAEVRFLGHDPIGPLSVSKQGRLASPEDSACRRWGPVGSRWRELDAYGRISGEVVVTKGERYDLTHCDELSVRRTRGKSGAGVYVAVNAPYTAPNYEVWFPTKNARLALNTTVSSLQSSIALIDPDHRMPLAKKSLFFSRRSNDAVYRWAAIGGRSLVIAGWNGTAWKVEHTFRLKGGKALDRAVRPLAVTDMNGDGEPEVVVHVLENEGEFYGDATFSRGQDGKWREIGPGIFGSTA